METPLHGGTTVSLTFPGGPSVLLVNGGKLHSETYTRLMQALGDTARRSGPITVVLELPEGVTVCVEPLAVRPWVSAGALRGFGFPVPRDVPDPWVVPFSAVTFTPDGAVEALPSGRFPRGALDLSAAVTITEPFQAPPVTDSSLAALEGAEVVLLSGAGWKPAEREGHWVDLDGCAWPTASAVAQVRAKLEEQRFAAARAR